MCTVQFHKHNRNKSIKNIKWADKQNCVGQNKNITIPMTIHSIKPKYLLSSRVKFLDTET